MKFCKSGLAVIETEAQAIFALTQRIDEKFENACALLLACKGRIVVTGMGKSGHIANKIASTLASTGSPAFFMHPGEASHGDLGMITKEDIVIAISHSGSTQELLVLLPLLKRLQIPLISLTGNHNSILANAANIHLDVSIQHEACPLNLAPTTSTTVALVMGDALAVALLEARGFSKEDFAFSHPGGKLGKRLLLTADEIAHTGNNIPQVNEKASIRDALIEVTRKKLGMTCIVNSYGILVGIYTDGDIRRTLSQDVNIHTTFITEVMTSNCRVIPTTTLAIDALNNMQEHSITSLVIINEKHQPTGVVHLHDLLRSGLV